MLLYFSGTGNSLAVAKQLAEKLNETLMPLSDAVRIDLTHEKRIGLVFPTYDFNMPPAVRMFISQLQINPAAYVFAVITCGGQVGNCILTLRRMLRKLGVDLAYSHKVSLPDNSAIAFGRNPNDQVKKFDPAQRRIEHIVSDLQAGRQTRHFCKWSFISWIMGLPAMEEGMVRTLRPKVNEDKCIGCEICAKVCPMGNISLTANSTDGQVANIGDNCTVCFSCLHFCPQQAVQVRGRETLKERQYHHPQIRLKDMLKR